ncbi:hypothetical protein [Saccharothrix sp. ST-888]|uniref:hypothetical protein n=1 Tax=Saccharothrix sp. ST-888 TaxID=1427391 RepID=UPI0005EC969B|nr:hypothetical protein [Saccharothrix sp. ST-888]KJK56101.1 hypothetical protein UK12_24480 [Saccharothrix sp. ST-888]
MPELSELERLIEADKRLGAAARFELRMRQVRIINGLEPAPEDQDEPEDGVKSYRLTARQVERIAAALEGHEDLEADSIRLSLDLPLLEPDDVSAGQGSVDGGSYNDYHACSRPRVCCAVRPAPISRR